MLLFFPILFFLSFPIRLRVRVIVRVMVMPVRARGLASDVELKSKS